MRGLNPRQSHNLLFYWSCSEADEEQKKSMSACKHFYKIDRKIKTRSGMGRKEKDQNTWQKTQGKKKEKSECISDTNHRTVGVHIPSLNLPTNKMLIHRLAAVPPRPILGDLAEGRAEAYCLDLDALLSTWLHMLWVKELEAKNF